MTPARMGPWAVLKETVSEFGRDDCPRLAAAIAYYTIFSLPPLLILLTLLAAAFVEPEEARRAMVSQAGELIGPEGARQIATMLREAERPEGGGLLPTALGLLALAFGATGAFIQLQSALNTAWDVRPKGGGIRGFLLKRLFSFGMIGAIAFLLLVSLVLTAVLAALGERLAATLPGMAGRSVFLALGLLVNVAVISALFATIFKVMPDAEVEWRDVRVGAIVTALLFVAGKFAIGFYLGRSDPGSAFGAAGSLALVLVWVYYSAFILLIGAEFTQVWARRRGEPIRPSPGAVRVGRTDATEAD